RTTRPPSSRCRSTSSRCSWRESRRKRRRMRVVVSGASGLIGSALVQDLEASGCAVARLVRREPRGADEIEWDPARGTLEVSRLEGFDAAVHLAGENLAA